MLLASPFTDKLQGYGTAAGAVIALLALGAAILAYRAQNRQLRHQQQQIADQQVLNAKQSEVLELQTAEMKEAVEERRRDAEERHREHAIHVYTTMTVRRDVMAKDTPEQAVVRVYRFTLTNAGALPIRDIIIEWPKGIDDLWLWPDTRLPLLEPGITKEFLRVLPAEVLLAHHVEVFPEAEFTDAAGTRWLLTLDGELSEWVSQEWEVVIPGRPSAEEVRRATIREMRYRNPDLWLAA